MIKNFFSVVGFILVALIHLPARAEYVIDISDPAVVPENEERLWFAYSVMLGMCIVENKFSYLNYSEQCEIAGRETMLQLVDKGEPLPPTEYFKQLQAVYKAGYLHEYVWRFQNKKYWTEPKDLKLNQFDAWAKQNLTGHVPQTRLRAKVSER